MMAVGSVAQETGVSDRSGITVGVTMGQWGGVTMRISGISVS